MDGLVSDYSSLLQNASRSDMTLICPGGGEVKVHSLIMATRSPVFDSMVKSDMEEMASGIVKINDFEIGVVKALVNYIYTAKIEHDFEDIIDLLKIGAKYLIKSLVEDCSKKLANLITVVNVFELGSLAEIFSVHSLMESCAKFVSKKLNVLENNWEDKLTNSPMFLVKIVKCMKSEAGFPLVSRFGKYSEVADWGLQLGMGETTDAIAIRLSHAATLTSIGFFGTSCSKYIKVKVSISSISSSYVYSVSTRFKSNRTNVPIMVPVEMEMVPSTKYTITAVLRCNFENTFTFCGKDGKQEVIYGDGLKVMFEDSPKFSSNTNVVKGQIPTLGFKIVSQ